MYIRDWGSASQLDLKRLVVKSVEATSDRLNNERLCALPLTLRAGPCRHYTLYQRWSEVQNDVTTLFQLRFNVGPMSNARWGVCRPCVETELTATKKSATDQSQLYGWLSIDAVLGRTVGLKNGVRFPTATDQSQLYVDISVLTTAYN